MLILVNIFVRHKENNWDVNNRCATIAIKQLR